MSCPALIDRASACSAGVRPCQNISKSNVSMPLACRRFTGTRRPDPLALMPRDGRGGCCGGSGPMPARSRRPCRYRRTRCGASGRPRSPRSASPRGTTGTPCARAPLRDGPTGQRPPRSSPSSSRQRTAADTGRGCPGAPVPASGSPHRRRAPAAVRSYSRHASFMHTDLRLCAFLASSGRFEMFRGEKRGCCVLSIAASRSKNQSDGQVERPDRSAAYLCMERDGQVVGYLAGARAAGAGWLALVALPCLPAVPPPDCRALPWWWWVHRTGVRGG